MSGGVIGFNLIGSDIPLAACVDAAQRLSGLLSEIERSISGKQSLEWDIADLGLGSAKLTIRPAVRESGNDDLGDRVISSALAGFKVIEDKARRPDHFTDRALDQARGFVTIADGGVERIAVFGGRDSTALQRVRVSRRLAMHVDRLTGTASVAVGSVEGTLEALSIHAGIAFSVYDVITVRRIQCICDRDTLKRAMQYLGCRVSLSGEVRFNVQGEPTSVQVDAFLPLAHEPLPQPGDVRGMFVDGKVDLDEWSRYVREG